MLKEYQNKRDFKQTPEPGPATLESVQGPLVFVVHKHAARRLHYDLRLELDGVLKSWAIPEGPSYNPAEKKLAVEVEDHPFDYRNFEGIIPKGQYGAGEVIIWDHGTFSPEHRGQTYFEDRQKAEDVIRHRLSEGKLSFVLRGEKLKGSWSLIKLRNEQKDWLLVKHEDASRPQIIDVLNQDRSVISGLRIEDLKAGARPPTDTLGITNPGAIQDARKAPFPRSLSPMLATLIAAPFSDPQWLFEPKLDGYRILSFIQNGVVTLLSRRGRDLTADFPQVVPALKSQPVAQAVFDGEMVALEKSGRSCFQCLQNHLDLLRTGKGGTHQDIRIVYYIFDLLYLDGYDLKKVPLYIRKKLLQQVLDPAGNVQRLDHFVGDGKTVFAVSVENGLEGAMGKRNDSVYEEGRRSRNWLKMKASLTGDFVVGGFLRGSGNRASFFGSLMLGYYGDGNKLIYVGNVGSGFDDASLSNLINRLRSITQEQSPFVKVPKQAAPVTWVRPELVAEVKFADWTHEEYLRAPVFLRLREDKDASEVHRPELASFSKMALIENKQEDSPPVRQTNQDVIRELRKSGDNLDLQVEGNRLSLTKLDKVFWPESRGRPAITKRDLLLYFATVAPYLLPHMKDRPLTLTRYPDGIQGEYFYQKHWSFPLPEFVGRAMLSEYGGESKEYMICNNLSTLLWLGQIADIELHTWFSRISPIPDSPDLSHITNQEALIDSLVDYPDFIIFDIDPYIYSGKEAKGAEPELNRRAFDKACEFARQLKEMANSISLSVFMKTSGKTGLHLFVPITRRYEYALVRDLAGTISRYVLKKYPNHITTEWAVEKRRGKIFMDFNQNVRGKTVASVYSPRVTIQATVSTPISWDEVGKVYPTDFTIHTVPERLARTGDLWSTLLESKKDLESVLGRLKKK